jgi:hypothetical protein
MGATKQVASGRVGTNQPIKAERSALGMNVQKSWWWRLPGWIENLGKIAA